MGESVKTKFMHQTTVEKNTKTHARPVSRKKAFYTAKKIFSIHAHVARKSFLVYERVENGFQKM